VETDRQNGLWHTDLRFSLFYMRPHSFHKWEPVFLRQHPERTVLYAAARLPATPLLRLHSVYCRRSLPGVRTGTVATRHNTGYIWGYPFQYETGSRNWQKTLSHPPGRTDSF